MLSGIRSLPRYQAGGPVDPPFGPLTLLEFLKRKLRAPPVYLTPYDNPKSALYKPLSMLSFLTPNVRIGAYGLLISRRRRMQSPLTPIHLRKKGFDMRMKLLRKQEERLRLYMLDRNAAPQT